MSKEHRDSVYDKEDEVTLHEHEDRLDQSFHSSYDEQDVFGAEENHQVRKAKHITLSAYFSGH